MKGLPLGNTEARAMVLGHVTCPAEALSIVKQLRAWRDEMEREILSVGEIFRLGRL